MYNKDLLQKVISLVGKVGNPTDGIAIEVDCPICGKTIDIATAYGETVLHVRLQLYKVLAENDLHPETCEDCGNYIPAKSLKDEADTCGTELFPHGVAAFSKAAHADESAKLKLIKKNMDVLFNNTTPDIEVCCGGPDDHIGPIGLYLRGEIVCASNKDLWSVRVGQKRWVDSDRYIPYNEEIREWDHKEVIISNPHVVGVWVKEWASSEVKELAYRYAKEKDLIFAYLEKRRKEASLEDPIPEIDDKWDWAEDLVMA